MKAIGFILFFTLGARSLFGQTKPIPIIISCAIEKGDSLICWKAKEDDAKVVYVLQQFRWNKWVDWDSLQSNNTGDTAAYSLNISKYYHSNVNIFRINPKSKGKVLMNSQKVTHVEKDYGELLKRIAFTQHNSPVDVTFEHNTWYEVYDKFGNIVRHGYGLSFSRRGLQGDVYYVNYDNKTSEVIWYYTIK